MKINKSTRHSKIAGDFGEMLVLYWLSKYGFECAKVDHTGIDLIAANPNTKKRMGISVKSRTRSLGSENEFIKLPISDFGKIDFACKSFGDLIPHFAIVVDAGDTIRVFISSTSHVLELFPMRNSGSGWRMTPEDLSRYTKDSEVIFFEFESKHGRWWKSD